MAIGGAGGGFSGTQNQYPTGYVDPVFKANKLKTQNDLNASGAPAGYEWDPVKQSYVRTAASLGGAKNQYENAANPALAGLWGSVQDLISGGGGGSTSSSTKTSSGFGGGSTGGGGSAGFGGAGSGITGGNYIAPIQLPDSSAASAGAYATAKDRVGQTGRASLDALRGELGATGMLGGGAEAQGVRDVIQSGAGELGQVSRDQAGTQAAQAADFAKTGYGGAITQRGQDVSAQEAQARLAQERELAQARMSFEQRQAQSSNQLQLLQLALAGLKGGTGGEIPGYSY